MISFSSFCISAIFVVGAVAQSTTSTFVRASYTAGIWGRPNATHTHWHGPVETARINNQSLHWPPPFWAPRPWKVDNTTIVANTSTIPPEAKVAVHAKRQATVLTTKGTFLVIARDATAAYSAKSGLNDYGIPFQLLLVPSGGIELPALTSSQSVGLFGGIVVLSEVSYPNAAGTYASALTSDQWNALYAYQRTFGVRMVRLDVVPSAASGTKVVGSCCDAKVEQLMSVNDTSLFPTAGLVQGATLSTTGLYHYPAGIVNSSLATPFAQFGTATGFTTNTVAGVINDFKDGRKQMLFFMGFATDWSTTSILLQHAWIHWASRGLYAGYRRVLLNTQVDDMFLTSPIYSGGTFRIEPADLVAHITWMDAVNAKLPKGSNYTMEVGHNGNGNIANSEDIDRAESPTCGVGSVSYGTQPDSTNLEYVKPLGSGTSLWASTLTTYSYSNRCLQLDPLEKWWADPVNRDAFSHVSHTFTHESEDQATYSDVSKEISWNQQWLAQVGLSNGRSWSGKGLIPPAITGLHNGDALKAWSDNGIVNAVGDNTRKVLLNTDNEHWPLYTTMASNNFVGVQITPRWATNIYYNCDTTTCDVTEWIAIATGSGTMTDLLALEKTTNVRHLLSLHHDAYMFHQANLRQADVAQTTVPLGLTANKGKWSLLQMWVEVVLGELVRVTTWPIISLKHDDLAAQFAQRMTRDKCNYSITLIHDPSGQAIIGLTVSATNNTCSAPIPVTLPAPVKDARKYTTEQIGNDPLTVWVDLVGKVVSLELARPLAW